MFCFAFNLLHKKGNMLKNKKFTYIKTSNKRGKMKEHVLRACHACSLHPQAMQFET